MTTIDSQATVSGSNGGDQVVPKNTFGFWKMMKKFLEGGTPTLRDIAQLHGSASLIATIDGKLDTLTSPSGLNFTDELRGAYKYFLAWKCAQHVAAQEAVAKRIRADGTGDSEPPASSGPLPPLPPGFHCPPFASEDSTFKNQWDNRMLGVAYLLVEVPAKSRLGHRPGLPETYRTNIAALLVSMGGKDFVQAACAWGEMVAQLEGITKEGRAQAELAAREFLRLLPQD